MRDLKIVPGTKRYVESIEEANEKVRALYPKATREGSLGAWHWAIKDGEKEEQVAEAWLHATRPGWWLRIKPK